MFIVSSDVSRLEIESGVEIRKLELGDVPTIHDLYPANDMEAIGVFQTLITKLPAYGEFQHSCSKLGVKKLSDIN